jgi:hypothetical protein
MESNAPLFSESNKFMITPWKNFLSIRNNRIEFIFSLIIISVSLYFYSSFLSFNESREGILLNDPLHNLFKPIDFTYLIFLFIYIPLFLVIILLIKKPEQIIIGLQAYTLLVLIRMAAMYLLPLESPAQMILLKDPFVEFFGPSVPLTKDLFFSGHTATLFLLFLISNKRAIKIFMLIVTFITASLLLLQHVHYTIDILAAPFFTYIAYYIAVKIKNRRS